MVFSDLMLRVAFRERDVGSPVQVPAYLCIFFASTPHQEQEQSLPAVQARDLYACIIQKTYENQGAASQSTTGGGSHPTQPR